MKRRKLRKPHYGRSKRFQTVRVVSWRNRRGRWIQVENVQQQKIHRYPTNRSTEKAKAIIIAGDIEVLVGDQWVESDEVKYLTTHTPFTKHHTIDDLAAAAEDRYSWRFV